MNVKNIDKSTWDLTATNPNRKDTTDKRTPAEILAEIEELDLEAGSAIAAIKELL
jgi:type I restriction enzyme M protein